MEVYVGKDVYIGKSTIQNLITAYNAWKNLGPVEPESELLIGRHVSVPEKTLSLWSRSKELHKMAMRIGENTRIGEDVSLGLGVSIGANCEIMDRCELSDFSTIHDRVKWNQVDLFRREITLEDTKNGERLTILLMTP